MVHANKRKNKVHIHTNKAERMRNMEKHKRNWAVWFGKPNSNRPIDAYFKAKRIELAISIDRMPQLFHPSLPSTWCGFLYVIFPLFSSCIPSILLIAHNLINMKKIVISAMSAHSVGFLSSFALQCSQCNILEVFFWCCCCFCCIHLDGMYHASNTHRHNWIWNSNVSIVYIVCSNWSDRKSISMHCIAAY